MSFTISTEPSFSASALYTLTVSLACLLLELETLQKMYRVQREEDMVDGRVRRTPQHHSGSASIPVQLAHSL